MTTTHEDLTSFYQFALDQLANGRSERCMEELVAHWRTVREREEVNERIRQAIDEMNAGLGTPLDEFMDELRKKYDIETT